MLKLDEPKRVYFDESNLDNFFEIYKFEQIKKRKEQFLIRLNA